MFQLVCSVSDDRVPNGQQGPRAPQHSTGHTLANRGLLGLERQLLSFLSTTVHLFKRHQDENEATACPLCSGGGVTGLTHHCHSGHHSSPFVLQPSFGVWRPGFEFQLCHAHFSASISLSTALPPFEGAMGGLRTKLPVMRQVCPVPKFSNTRTGINLHPLKDALGSKTGGKGPVTVGPYAWGHPPTDTHTIPHPL